MTINNNFLITEVPQHFATYIFQFLILISKICFFFSRLRHFGIFRIKYLNLDFFKLSHHILNSETIHIELYQYHNHCYIITFLLNPKSLVQYLIVQNQIQLYIFSTLQILFHSICLDRNWIGRKRQKNKWKERKNEINYYIHGT